MWHCWLLSHRAIWLFRISLKVMNCNIYMSSLRLNFEICGFPGLIWFIVPVSMIVCNDVMAYVFGFFFGRTPLIKLSPKKTWEGFIGGGLSTVAFGIAFSYLLCQYQFFVCPIEYSETAGRAMECEPSYLFRPQEYSLGLVSARKLHRSPIQLKPT